MLLGVKMTWAMTLSVRWVHRCGEKETKKGRERSLVGKTHMTTVSLSLCTLSICHRRGRGVYLYKAVNEETSGLLCLSVAGGRLNGHSRPERKPDAAGYESSSTLMSSELDTTSFFDSEEDDSASRWVKRLKVICILLNVWSWNRLISVVVWFSIFLF